MARAETKQEAIAVAALALLAAAFWADCIFGGKVPVAAIYQRQMLPWAATAEASLSQRQWDSLLWDSMAQFYPWRLLLHRAAQADELPLWNPYQFSGYAFVGNGQSAIFYPLNWLYFWWPPAIGLSVSAAGHFFLAGLFVYGLARAWRLGRGPSLFAALAFSYGGFMVTWIELPTLPNSVIWLPLALWGLEWICRGREGSNRPGDDAQAFCRAAWGMIMLAVALGMAILAGHLQIAAYVWIFAGLYGLVRLSAAFVSEKGTRAKRTCLLRAGAMGLAFLWGGLLAAAQALPTWELGQASARGIGGPSPEGFAFHQQRALQPIELLNLFWPDWLGTPVKGNYSGISYSEHCGFVGAITILLMGLGVGLKPRRATALLFGGIGLVALWGAMAGLPAWLLYWGVPKLGQAGGFGRLLSVWTLAAAMSGAAGLQALIEQWEEQQRRDKQNSARPVTASRARLWTAGAIVLLLAQVLPWAYRFNPRAAAKDVYPETELIRVLRRQAQSGRRLVIVNSRERWGLGETPTGVVLPPNAATVYGLRSVDGYDSLFPAAYRRRAAEIEQADPSPLANGNMLLLQAAERWLARGAALAVAPESWPGKGLQEIWRGEGCKILVGPKPPAPRGSVTIKGEGEARPITIVQERLNALRVALPPLKNNGTLIWTEALDKDWQAYVDGKGPIAPVKHNSEGVSWPLPAGARHVDLVYWPTSVVLGLFVSGVALAGIMALGAALMSGRQARALVIRKSEAETPHEFA